MVGKKACALVKEAIIIIELMPATGCLSAKILKRFALHRFLRDATHRLPCLAFLPDGRDRDQADTRWQLPPDMIIAFLKIFGFSTTHVCHHRQTSVLRGTSLDLYTVAGRR